MWGLTTLGCSHSDMWGSSTSGCSQSCEGQLPCLHSHVWGSTIQLTQLYVRVNDLGMLTQSYVRVNDFGMLTVICEGQWPRGAHSHMWGLMTSGCSHSHMLGLTISECSHSHMWGSTTEGCSHTYMSGSAFHPHVGNCFDSVLFFFFLVFTLLTSIQLLSSFNIWGSHSDFSI